MAINLKKLFGKNREEQPLDLTATPTGSGGKRVNQIPSVIAVFFLVLALGAVAYVAHIRSQNKITPGMGNTTEHPKEGRSASQMASDATSPWTSGQIPPADRRGMPNMPDVPDKSKDETKTQESQPQTPASNPFSAATPHVDPYAEDRLRIRERRFQALEAALKSKMSVQLSELRNRSTTRDINTQLAETRQRLASMTDPSSAYQNRLAQLRGETASGADELYQPTATGRNDIRRFESNSWELDSQVEAPASPYMIRAGFVLPAIMISGINSDLPGQVMAGQPERLRHGHRTLPSHPPRNQAYRHILQRRWLWAGAGSHGLAASDLPRREDARHSRHARSRQRRLCGLLRSSQQPLVPHHIQRHPHVRCHCRRRSESG